VKWQNPIGIATHQPHLFSFANRIKSYYWYYVSAQNARHEILLMCAVKQDSFKELFILLMLLYSMVYISVAQKGLGFYADTL